MHESDFIQSLAKFMLGDCFDVWKTNRNYLELGIAHAITWNKVAPLFQNAVAVDILPCFEKDSNPLQVNSQFFQTTTKKFISNELPQLGLTFKLIFIDANHSKDSVLSDFHGVLPYLDENGIIILHDSYPHSKSDLNDGCCSDCYKAIDEIKDSMNYARFEILTLPARYGLTLFRRLPKVRPHEVE